MPLKGTTGALAQFTQGYVAPLPVSNVSAVPANPGIGGTISFTPNVFLGAPETYVANSNVGNFVGTSTSSPTLVGDMAPFKDYFFTIKATSAGGNSDGIITNSITVNCNVVTNTTTSITPTPQQLLIDPDGSQMHLVTFNRWLRYTRNSTGQLTLVSSVSPPSVSTLNSIAIPYNDNTRVYLCGTVVTNNNPVNTFATTVIWYYKKTNTVGAGSFTLQQTLTLRSAGFGYPIAPNWLLPQFSNNRLVVLSQYSPDPRFTPYSFYSMFISVNPNTGLMSAPTLGSNLSIYGSYFIPSRFTSATSEDQKYSYVILQESSTGKKDILGFEGTSAPSVTNITTGVLTNYVGLAISKDSNSVYAFNNNTINIFSRTPNSVALTQTSNVAAPAGTTFYGGCVGGGNTIVFTGGGKMYSRDLGTGSLTLINGSNSFIFPANTTGQVVYSIDSKNIYTLQGNNIAIFNTVS